MRPWTTGSENILRDEILSMSWRRHGTRQPHPECLPRVPPKKLACAMRKVLPRAIEFELSDLDVVESFPNYFRPIVPTTWVRSRRTLNEDVAYPLTQDENCFTRARCVCLARLSMRFRFIEKTISLE